MIKPLYKHDCNNCTFLGTFNNEDLYFCKQGGHIPTLIVRYSSDGPDYSSGFQFGEREKNNLNSSIGEAYRLAKKLNLC